MQAVTKPWFRSRVDPAAISQSNGPAEVGTGGISLELEPEQAAGPDESLTAPPPPPAIAPSILPPPWTPQRGPPPLHRPPPPPPLPAASSPLLCRPPAGAPRNPLAGFIPQKSDTSSCSVVLGVVVMRE